MENKSCNLPVLSGKMAVLLPDFDYLQSQGHSQSPPHKPSSELALLFPEHTNTF